MAPPGRSGQRPVHHRRHPAVPEAGALASVGLPAGPGCARWAASLVGLGGVTGPTYVVALFLLAGVAVIQLT